MYMNVARPIVAGAPRVSFSLVRRSFASDPYISNRNERQQDKRDTGKSAETWKNDTNPQDWKQSGEKNFEGMQAPMSEQASDQTDKGRFDNESGGQGSYAAREQAARDQANGMNQKSNSAFGMSGRSKDDPDKALNYNSSWAKDNSSTSTDKATNMSSRDSNTFGMTMQKPKAKDNHSFDMKDRSNSGDSMKNTTGMSGSSKSNEGKDSSVGINDLNDQARNKPMMSGPRDSQFDKPMMSGSGLGENQFNQPGSGQGRDSNSSFGMDERSPTSTRDRVREGELNASSGMSDMKQTNSAFGLGNPKRDFSIAKNTKDKAASTAQSVKDTASSAAQAVKDKASSAAQTIKAKAGNAEQTAADYGKQAADKVKEKAGDAKEYFDKKKTSNDK